MASKEKKRGFGLELKSFQGRGGRNYLAFRTRGGSYHAFVEVEAKQAARECGVKVEKTTRAMWRAIWNT